MVPPRPAPGRRRTWRSVFIPGTGDVPRLNLAMPRLPGRRHPALSQCHGRTRALAAPDEGNGDTPAVHDRAAQVLFALLRPGQGADLRPLVAGIIGAGRW